MSASEGSLGSGSPSPAAPPSAPAAAPPSATPPPAAAPAEPAVPAVATPDAAPQSDAVAPSTPGASPAQPAKPTSLDAAKELYHQRKADIEAAQQAAQSKVSEPPAAEPPPVTPEPPAAPKVEAQPAEEPAAAPIVEPEPPAPAEEAAPIELEDVDYREKVWTPEETETRFQRKLSKTERAEVAQREAHRGELLETYHSIGGEIGAKIASVINPIILGEDNPTTEHVDAIFDQIVLPENAGAGKLFALMGQHLINTQLQDPETGREFGSNMIAEEWGKNEDGTAFDFWGMKPIEFADLLIRAAKYKDEEGNGLINREFLESELAGNANKPKPSQRELEVLRELEELKAKTATETQAKDAEQKRELAERQAVYKTQAFGFVSQHIMRAVMPLATKANWAAVEGDTDSAEAQERMQFGELVSDHINYRLMGPVSQQTPEYQAITKMIEENTAFDATGRATPRFLAKLEPLTTKAKALFNRKQIALAPRIKFTAQQSRNAQLVKEKGASAPAETAPPPQIAATPVNQPGKKPTSAELLEAERQKYRDKVRAAQQSAGVTRT